MFSLDPQLVALAEGSGSMATWEWNPATDELRWTSGQAEIYSRSALDLNSSRAWESIVHPEDRQRIRSAIEAALASGTGFRERFRVTARDGGFLWIFGYGKIIRNSDASIRVVGLNVDITDLVEALSASETRFTATFEQAAVGIAHVAPDGTWLNVNHRCLEILGYSREELLDLTFSAITHPDDLEADWALVRELLEGKRSTYSMEKRYFTRDRRLIWVNLTVSLVRKADGTPNYFISVIEDITSRKIVEKERDDLIAELEHRVRLRTAELEALSHTDPLTGIANRRAFDRFLSVEWARACRTRQPLSVILIDIDFFKDFNDTCGHVAADQALKSVAGCLRDVAQRSTDLAARYGGDEFVLVLPHTDAEGALAMARRIQAMVDRLEITNFGSRIGQVMTVSQGVATACPDAKGDCERLMLEADRALYRAKESGRARVATCL